MFDYFKALFRIFKIICGKNGSLYFSIPIGKLRYDIYERPGAWASDRELKKITDDLLEVARNCQGKKDIPIYGVLTGERDDLSKRLLTIAYNRKTNKPLGFSAQIFLDLKDKSFKERILHLGLIFVDESTRGKNISYLLSVFPNLLIIVKNGFRDIWVSNVSQVPAVVGLVDQNYSRVYPTIKSEKQSFRHRKLSSLMVRDHHYSFGVGPDADFDNRNQVIMNAYTGGSDNLKKKFEEAPKHRIDAYNQLCESLLDYERGDDFLQLGVLSPIGFVELFKKKIPNTNKILIGLSICVIALFSVLVLIYRWINDQVDTYESKNTGPLIL